MGFKPTTLRVLDQNLTLRPLKGKMRHLVQIQYNGTKITKIKAMV